MKQAVALGLLCVASALFYAADRPRGVGRWPFFTLTHSRIARAAALALVLAGGVLWNSGEPGPAAFLAVPVALMAFGTLLTLVAPVAPRLLWALVAAALPLSVLCAYLGGNHG
jgi:hypothetical protein